MSVLEKYVDSFNSNDSKVFASIFAEDCVFSDTAPTKAGMDPMWVNGRECVDMIFNMYFNNMPMSATFVSLNGNELDYFIHYPGFDMPCRGTLLEEENGLIKRYSVAFREVQAP